MGTIGRDITGSRCKNVSQAGHMLNPVPIIVCLSYSDISFRVSCSVDVVFIATGTAQSTSEAQSHVPLLHT